MNFDALARFMDHLTSWRIPGNGIKVCLEGEEVLRISLKEKLVT